jgi:hypothetical protein
VASNLFTCYSMFDRIKMSDDFSIIYKNIQSGKN